MDGTSTVRTLLRQPLLHFLLAGAAIFALNAFRGEPASPASQRIVVTSTHIERLANRWQMTWGRPPGDAEIQTLVRNYIKEEVYYREAIKLGLDVNDSVIRQRLGRKMEFLSVPELSESSATDSELKAFFQARAERYKTSPVLSFEHVYFAKDAGDELAQALTQLQNGASAEGFGDSIGLPENLAKADQSSITRTFGSEFYDGLVLLDASSWAGPVKSGFGYHLVKISERQEARVPEFEDVRATVVNDWLADKNAALQEQAYEQLRAKYNVEIELLGD